MELVKTGAGKVTFYLDITFLSQYELDFETFERRKPFAVKIIDDLLNFANVRYGLDFDDTDTPKAIYVVADCVVMVFEKRNQNCLQSEENEELEIMKGIREIFCFLPDEKIDFELMEVEKKRKLLEEIRSDDNMTYIRENFFMYD
ncbi:MAG: hypothetical protein K2K90_00175 [Lachnospiraceae bacterium]|nr:hypothetical protein [Lachnospiraceae bacterium]